MPNLRTHSHSCPVPQTTKLQTKWNGPAVREPLSPRLSAAAAVFRKARGQLTRRFTSNQRVETSQVYGLPPRPDVTRTEWFYASVRPRAYILRGRHLAGFGNRGPTALEDNREVLPAPTEETFAQQWAQAPAEEFAYRAAWLVGMDAKLASAPVRHPCVCRDKLSALEPSQLGVDFYLWYIQRWALYREGGGIIGSRWPDRFTEEQCIRAELDMEACFGIFRSLKESDRAPRVLPASFSISNRYLGGESLLITLVVRESELEDPDSRLGRYTPRVAMRRVGRS